MVLSHCGETTTGAIPKMIPFVIGKNNKLSTALDSDGIWAHNVNHTHYIWLDFGEPHYITNIRGVLNINTNIRQVHFYIGDDTGDMGDAVLVVDDWQAYSKEDADPWEYQVNAPKVGRYVLIMVLSTTDPDNYLRWG